MRPYPTEFELDMVLRDGHVVQIRPIRADDQDALAALFDATSPESRYFRFFRAKDRLSPKELAYFTSVDYDRRMAFIVFDEDAVVAVARYDRLGEDPDAAEVAFMVADAHQGRGIGTHLLQLLTTHARLTGVTVFEALVMSDNAAMLRLFRSSGYSLDRKMGRGVYEVRFPTAESEGSSAADDRRERIAVANSLLPFFVPRAVAVVGASDSPGSIGGTLFRNLVDSDYTGELYPIHPRATTVADVPAYASVLDAPGPIDLVFIVVPGPSVYDVAAQCAEAGVRSIVVISAGFSEVGGHGVEEEQRLLRLVRDSGMRMVGPNCMGLLNTNPVVQLNGTFAPVFPPAGNVAMSSQSGALGIAILEHARRTGIGISTFVSVGNKADVSSNDLLLYWEDDPATDVIVLYVESFGNPRRFSRLARRIAKTKPIVAVKSGRTVAGQRAASSHTGALASGDRAADALFRQAGVIRTDTLEELFGVTSLLANQPIPKGRRVAIVTNAGGPAILAADALDARGLDLVEFSESLQVTLAGHLPPEASVVNPVDMIAGAGAQDFERALSAVAASGEVDAVIAIYVPVSDDGAATVAHVLKQFSLKQFSLKQFSGGNIPILSVFMSREDPAELLADSEVRVPSFVFPEAAAQALARVVSHGEWLERPPGNRVVPEGFDVDTVRAVVDRAMDRIGDDGWLDPGEVNGVLVGAGFRVPAEAVVRTADDAVSAASAFSGSAVLKVISPSALHKSDVGGIALDVAGGDSIRDAFDRVSSSVPDATGVLVQEMAPAGHEVLIGLSEDPVFGPLIVFGIGGVYVELLEDVSFRIHPLTDLDASEMIAEIKAAPLLDGYRSFPRGDRPAVVDALLRLSHLIDVVPELVELDLNPVLVHPPGDGATVVDGRMRIVRRDRSFGSEITDLPSVVGRQDAR